MPNYACQRELSLTTAARLSIGAAPIPNQRIPTTMIDLQRHEAIKRALRARGLSFAALAETLEPPVTGAAMTRVSQGYSRSARIEAALCAALETTPQQLWPERFEPAPWEVAA